MKLIVNVTPNWGIGLENHLLVSIPADLRHFRALTTGKTVIYGRKTLLTFPNAKPLPKRENIILSGRADLTVENATVVHSEAELFTLLRSKPQESLCVIGGESVYRLLLPYCDEAAVTVSHIDARADRFFPNLDALPNWQIASTCAPEQWEGVQYQFIDYQNSAPKAFG